MMMIQIGVATFNLDFLRAKKINNIATDWSVKLRTITPIITPVILEPQLRFLKNL